MEHIDNAVIDGVFKEAKLSDKLRANYCLHTSPSDNIQKMLNVLIPGSRIPIHRHHNTCETLILLRGKAIVVYYDDIMGEEERIVLSQDNVLCIDIPKEKWHSVEIEEPVVLFEIKEGPYRPLCNDEVAENND